MIPHAIYLIVAFSTLGQYFWKRQVIRAPGVLKLVQAAPQLKESLDELEFTSLQKIIMGFSKHDLATQIKLDPAAVHQVDLYGLTALHWAVRKKDMAAVKMLLNAGANVNAVCKIGRSALYYAAANGLTEFCERLLEAGASTTLKDHNGEDALIQAMKDRPTSVPSVVSALLKYGADPNSADVPNHTTCLIFASTEPDPESARLLLDYGANVYDVDYLGRDPIFWAVCQDNADMVKLLCSRGAIRNRSKEMTYTLMSVVACYCSIEVMQILRAEARHMRLDPVDTGNLWWEFDFRRADRYKGLPAPYAIEDREYSALVDSIILAGINDEEEEKTTLNIPGAFPDAVDHDSEKHKVDVESRVVELVA